MSGRSTARRPAVPLFPSSLAKQHSRARHRICRAGEVFNEGWKRHLSGCAIVPCDHRALVILTGTVVGVIGIDAVVLVTLSE
jgi:hypothetical protein